MGFSCSNCVVCMDVLPEQKRERIHFVGKKDTKVLVIDDCFDQDLYAVGIDVAQKLLGTDIDFTYTTTVRCEYDRLDDEVLQRANSCCAVWTNQLLENRSLILTTERGLQQMRLVTDKKEGDLFLSQQYGAVLVIPPLRMIGPGNLSEYRTKARRLVKHACLEKKT